MRGRLAAAVLLVGAGCVQSAAAAQVTVTVTGIRDGRGVVRVAICPRADFLQPHCPYVAHVPAAPGAVQVTITGVPPGVYAAQAFQDANDNGILDRNWLGFPKEGMGFSRNAPMRFGPPAFKEAAFTIDSDASAISFLLRYFSPP
jgi:uncharacterized protein (DUF2141 family)